jgi:hypothetical protein
MMIMIMMTTTMATVKSSTTPTTFSTPNDEDVAGVCILIQNKS